MDQGARAIGTVLQESYRIERLLGEGGMGAVYEASHLRIARRFAIKLLTPAAASNAEAMARFRREAEITSALGHPHIIEVIDFNHTPAGEPYIIMELLRGEDLGTRLQRLGRLDLPEAASIFRQATSALQAAHDEGIVHRDLKPQNIFLCRREERDDFVKVVDFGISKVLGAQSLLTRTQTLMGTPLYMSPEQADERAANVDHRSDIYSLAAIVWNMLVGTLPFTAASMPSLLYKIVHEEVPSLRAVRPDLPSALGTVISRGLRKRREERFGSMAEFRKAFDEAVLPAGQGTLRGPALGHVATEPAQLVDPPAPPLETPTPAAAPSTTLSASVGELRPMSPARSRRLRWGAVGAVATVTGIAVLALFVTRGTAPRATQPLAAPPRIDGKEPAAPPPQTRAPAGSGQGRRRITCAPPRSIRR
jgi:serine/threonine-protein kinase